MIATDEYGSPIHMLEAPERDPAPRPVPEWLARHVPGPMMVDEQGRYAPDPHPPVDEWREWRGFPQLDPDAGTVAALNRKRAAAGWPLLTQWYDNGGRVHPLAELYTAVEWHGRLHINRGPTGEMENVETIDAFSATCWQDHAQILAEAGWEDTGWWTRRGGPLHGRVRPAR